MHPKFRLEGANIEIYTNTSSLACQIFALEVILNTALFL